jgi:hypothetical protein
MSGGTPCDDAAPIAPIALLRSLPSAPLTAEFERYRRLAELFAAFDRDDIEAGIDLLLAELDARDGDSDFEETRTEDDFCEHFDDGPGCPVSDAGGHAGLFEDDEATLGVPEAASGRWCGNVTGGDFTEDNEAEEDGFNIRRSHRDRIRRTRCDAKVTRSNFGGSIRRSYTLKPDLSSRNGDFKARPI